VEKAAQKLLLLWAGGRETGAAQGKEDWLMTWLFNELYWEIFP
jgi:hypothetical protein